MYFFSYRNFFILCQAIFGIKKIQDWYQKSCRKIDKPRPARLRRLSRNYRTACKIGFVIPEAIWNPLHFWCDRSLVAGWFISDTTHPGMVWRENLKYFLELWHASQALISLHSLPIPNKFKHLRGDRWQIRPKKGKAIFFLHHPPPSRHTHIEHDGSSSQIWSEMVLKLCRIFLKTASKPWGFEESSAKQTPCNENRKDFLITYLYL